MTKIVIRKTIDEIIEKANIEDLIQNIEYAFTSYSDQKAVVPPVGTLSFKKPPGDVHIKYGYIEDDDYYVIKIASGFYDNNLINLPTGNGLNLVFNKISGMIEAILLDEGILTELRTAIAGAVVAKHLAPKKVHKIGILGTGFQARYQLKYLKNVVDCKEVLVWGRSQERLNEYKKDMEAFGFKIETTLNADDVAGSCNLIVTATPSTSPLLSLKNLQKDILITAMGADTEGKQELDEDILIAADLIVMDSTSQCQSHGEIHKTYKKNNLKNKMMVELGDIISKGFERHGDRIIVADLTGIATQDIQISKFLLENIR